MPEWSILSRVDCSLCEAMHMELLEWLGDRRASLRVIDITSDPELERKYGSRIPVLLIDGEFVCAYRLDAERVRRHLEGDGG